MIDNEDTTQDKYDAIVASIKNETLDNRTAVAKALKATRDALSNNPGESIRAILRNNLAILVMLQNELMRETQYKPLTNNGRLNQGFTKDLLALQKVMQSNCNLLSLIEGVNSSKWKQSGGIKTDGNIDVASLILDIDNGGKIDVK